MLTDTIKAYAEKRAKSAPLPAGNAPYTSSAFFKLRPQADKPRAKDWTHHLSVEGRSQTISTLKEATKNATQAKLLSLGTARPAAEFYPWISMTMETRDLASAASQPQNHTTSTVCAMGGSSFDLGIALNYGYAAGSPQMVRFFTEHVEMLHSPPYQDWETCLTCSTTSAIDILLRVLCNRGDWIITEEYTYPGTMEAARRMGVNIVSVVMDEQGLLPEDLDQKLRQWTGDTRKPSVLYMIPSGHNPTGTTQSTERRLKIYAVAERHDLLIIEDDPYHLIQLGKPYSMPNGIASTSISDRYLQHLPPSYLSMDISGRVLRMETSSKILAPGLRCGWMTGSSQLVSKFTGMTELSTVAPSGPSQVMLCKLLDENWGHEGLLTWLNALSAQYRHRLGIMISACKSYLPLSICTWSAPKSGMFLWIRVEWSRHPIHLSSRESDCPNSGIMLKIEDSIHKACTRHGVQVSKGSWFAPSRPITNHVFFRLTFAAIAEHDLVEAIVRFGGALYEDFSMQD